MNGRGSSHRRLIALTGFMGTGKTSVAKRLAERLGWSFVDTDVMIERREGRSVADIFARDGESHFRAREREAIAEAMRQRDVVVATGGGAVVDDANFEALCRSSLLVCLTAEPGVILARTGGGARPLLQTGDREGRIRELLAARSAAYARVPNTIDTSHLSVDQIVDRILALLEAEEGEV